MADRDSLEAVLQRHPAGLAVTSPRRHRRAHRERDPLHVLVGGASLPYVNAAEVRLLTGRDPNDSTWIYAHADGMVSILLPGLP